MRRDWIAIHSLLCEIRRSFELYHRVTKEQQVELVRLIGHSNAETYPQVCTDWMLGQLQGYHMGLQGVGGYENVRDIFELSAWKHAWRWANAGVRRMGTVEDKP